jgi:hypothetical protein
MAEDRRSFPELVAASQAALPRSRALVEIPSAESPSELEHFSGLGATFLAHLIATRDRAPQTRARNRLLATEAVSSYEQAAPHDDETIPIKDS